MIIKIFGLVNCGLLAFLLMFLLGSFIYSHLSEVLYERKLRKNYRFISKESIDRYKQENAELKKRLNEYDELFDRIYRSKGNDFDFGIKIITDKPINSDKHKFIYKYPASELGSNVFGPSYNTSVYVQIMQDELKTGRRVALSDIEDKPDET